MREAIEETVERILVGVDGFLTIQAGSEGLLGIEGIHVPLGEREEEERVPRHTLRSSSARQWAVQSTFPLDTE